MLLQFVNTWNQLVFVDSLLINGCKTYNCRPGYVKELTGRTFRAVETVYVSGDQWHAYVQHGFIAMSFTAFGMAVLGFVFRDYIKRCLKERWPG
jgi:hypothetical protein